MPQECSSCKIIVSRILFSHSHLQKSLQHVSAHRRPATGRSNELKRHREAVSREANVMQLQDELKAMPPSDRQTLLEDTEFKIEIAPLKSLALKANLCLPWNKLRNLKRYKSSPHVQSTPSLKRHNKNLLPLH